MRTIIALSALLLSTHVYGGHPPKEEPNDPLAVAGAASDATAVAGAAAGVYAPIDIDIAVTPPPAGAPQPIDVSADGGEGYSSASANNEGVTTTVNQTTNYKRNAPSIAQGSLMAAGCGAGANGGGSKPGGAGFLGFVWTTDQCYALLAAASYQSIGMPDTSCDLLNSMKSVQKAFKRMGKPLPDCTTAENRDVTSAAGELVHGLTAIERMKPAPKCTDCATKTELDRAFRKSNEK